MKKSILLISALLLSVSAFSQKVELSLLTGYQGWGKFYTNLGTVKIDDAQSYGGTIGLPIRKGLQLEFMYMRQDTKLYYQSYYNAPNEKLPDLSINYYLLGLTRYISLPNERIVPFSNFGLGAMYAAPKSSIYSDKTMFAFDFNLGLKIYLTDYLGLRGQAGLYVPIQGVGVTIGTGGAGLSTMSTIVQGNISGGIVLSLPSKKKSTPGYTPTTAPQQQGNGQNQQQNNQQQQNNNQQQYNQNQQQFNSEQQQQNNQQNNNQQQTPSAPTTPQNNGGQ